MRKKIVSPLRLLAAAVLLLSFSFHFAEMNGTLAAITDAEKSEGNKFQAGTWGGDASQQPKPGDVVINEIMWMGSVGNSDDEWIELRNMTGHEIDLSNCNIIHGGAGAGGHIEIPQGYTIKAHGYFLLTKKKWNETAINLLADLEKDEGYTHIAGMSLHNDGEQLILEIDDGHVIIDSAWIETEPRTSWPAGSNATQKKSMQRNNPPGDGTQAASWSTCTNPICNDSPIYWDAEGNNYGTPRYENVY